MSPRPRRKTLVVGDVDFEPEDRVFFMFGSANRDEACFDDPDRFDITRDNPKKHRLRRRPTLLRRPPSPRARWWADVALPGHLRAIEGPAARRCRAG